MAFDFGFTLNASVKAGEPTKASEGNQWFRNSEALRERFLIAHHFNVSGVEGEDGFLRGEYDDPVWIYNKTDGMYCGLWIDTSGSSPHLRIMLQDSTAEAANASGGEIVVTGELGGFPI